MRKVIKLLHHVIFSGRLQKENSNLSMKKIIALNSPFLIFSMSKNRIGIYFFYFICVLHVVIRVRYNSVIPCFITLCCILIIVLQKARKYSIPSSVILGRFALTQRLFLCLRQCGRCVQGIFHKQGDSAKNQLCCRVGHPDSVQLKQEG